MNMIFVDTETGGLNPLKHSLLQVGLAYYADKKVIDTMEFYISQAEYVVTPAAMRINNIDLTQAQIYGFSPINAVNSITSFMRILNFDSDEEKPILAGHNIALDRYMLKHLFESQGKDLDSIVSHRTIDTMSLIWTLHYIGKLPLSACSSDGAYEYFSIKNEKKHSALSDCIATVQLFEKLIEMIEQIK